MKELKFRVWLHDRGYMETAHFDDGKWVSTDGIFSLEVGENDFIEQYTGLKDKNGKEIYGGDILDDGEGHIGKVLYNERIASFAYEWGNCGSTFMGLYTSDMKVIGNVHENPELLEGEE